MPTKPIKKPNNQKGKLNKKPDHQSYHSERNNWFLASQFQEAWKLIFCRKVGFLEDKKNVFTEPLKMFKTLRPIPKVTWKLF